MAHSKTAVRQGRLHGAGGSAPTVEGVYAPDDELDDTPEVLFGSEDEACGQEISDKTTAEFNLLALENGYAKFGPWFNAEEGGEVFTRLGEKTRIVRLARIEGGTVRPYYDRDDPTRAWSLSEIAIRDRWLGGAKIAAAWEEQVEAIRKNWPKFQRGMLIAPVEENGNLLLDDPAVALRYGENGLEKA